MSERRAKEAPIPIGKAFSRQFTATIPASWGAPTGTPVITIYQMPEKTDVTAMTTSGSGSVVGQLITTKSVLRSGMTPGRRYLAVLEFSLTGGGTDSCYWEMDCEE